MRLTLTVILHQRLTTRMEPGGNLPSNEWLNLYTELRVPIVSLLDNIHENTYTPIRLDIKFKMWEIWA